MEQQKRTPRTSALIVDPRPIHHNKSLGNLAKTFLFHN
jgi:hypothetical protein